ncbi:MAG: DUF3179 domain-containing protein [Pseudomonadota bacterium]|nr:DUF3179 domain-containing protein [Pseudomonadota bacterium]
MKKYILLPTLLGILVYFVNVRVLPAMTLNGFDLDQPLVAEDQIKRGGPPRDGIPSIDKPKFVSVADADHLKADDRVLGLVINNEARAYPIVILNWHEIVNDEFDGQAVVISYCPLCGTGMAFSPEPPVREFGVSGLLYNSDMLLYDRETESLWSQIMATAISGPMKGKKLAAIPISHTSWSDWKAQHPGSRVLSTQTGYARDYSKTPYGDYEKSNKIFFPVAAGDQRYHNKEWVLGVNIGETYKAYPFSELAKTSSPVKDSISGQQIEVFFDRNNSSASARDEQGRQIPALMSYWFAWYAFHPDTEVYRVP